MGLTPNDIDQPRRGELVQLAYEVDRGVGSTLRGEAAGTVSEILTDEDGDFVGFKIEGRENLKTAHSDAIVGLTVKARSPRYDLDVYSIAEDGRILKVNAIPGCVDVNPGDYGSEDAQREQIQ